MQLTKELTYVASSINGPSITTNKFDDSNKAYTMLKELQNANKCTYLQTKETYLIQEWFECETCNLVGNLGCCVSCLRTCHIGHTVKNASKISLFYCDCYKNKSNKCKHNTTGEF